MALMGDVRVPVRIDLSNEAQRILDVLGRDVEDCRREVADLRWKLAVLQVDYDEIERKHGILADLISNMPASLSDMAPEYYNSEEQHEMDMCYPVECRYCTRGDDDDSTR